MASERVGQEQRAATLARLAALQAAGTLGTAHVRQAAGGLHVAERTVWRWLNEAAPARTGPKGFQLSAADRAVAETSYFPRAHSRCKPPRQRSLAY
jgi:hypothetical protein